MVDIRKPFVEFKFETEVNYYEDFGVKKNQKLIKKKPRDRKELLEENENKFDMCSEDVNDCDNYTPVLANTISILTNYLIMNM